MSTYASTVPGASGYAGAALLAQKAYDNAMSRYQQQRGNTLLKYGYTRGADGSYGVDANNEYGGYQQMLKKEAGSAEALDRAQAGSGWGGDSGYLGAQRDQQSYNVGGEQAQFGQQAQSELTGIDQGEQDAAYARDAALYQAQEQAAQQAIAGQQFDPGDYSGIDAQVPYGNQAPPAPAQKTAKPVPHPQQRARLVQRQAARRAAAKKKGGR